MKWIVGLGNPGSEYENTRHNVGFGVLDELVRSLEATWRGGKGDYLLAQTRYQGERIGLVKPLTYMNNSGLAVANIVERYEAALQDVLVVCDDINLPLGQLRLRPMGSDGGHNGLYSIIYQLRTEAFPRLRCGIASEEMPREKEKMATYVLSVFEPDERPVVKRMIPRAAEASLCYAVEGADRAMTRYNQPIS
ncbi:MAG: aminoacyl-tRNA hydrolase [Bacteroidota bacterium]